MAEQNSIEVGKSDNHAVKNVSTNPKTCIVMENQLSQVIPDNPASTAYKIVPDMLKNADLGRLLDEYSMSVSTYKGPIAPKPPQNISAVCSTAPKFIATESIKIIQDNKYSKLVSINPNPQSIPPVSSTAPKLALKGMIKNKGNMYLMVQPTGPNQNTGPQAVASNQSSGVLGQAQTTNQLKNVVVQRKTPGLIVQKAGMPLNQVRLIQPKPTNPSPNLQTVVSSNQSILRLHQSSKYLKQAIPGLPKTSVSSNQAISGLPKTQMLLPSLLKSLEPNSRSKPVQSTPVKLSQNNWPNILRKIPETKLVTSYTIPVTSSKEPVTPTTIVTPTSYFYTTPVTTTTIVTPTSYFYTTPVTSYTKPVTPCTITPFTKPATVHTIPVTVHTKPATVHTKPVTVHTIPVTVHTKTVTNHTKPVTVHTIPVTVHTKTVTVHTKPATVHTRPVNVHTIPVTVHTKTVTNHTKPVTVHTVTPFKKPFTSVTSFIPGKLIPISKNTHLNHKRNVPVTNQIMSKAISDQTKLSVEALAAYTAVSLATNSTNFSLVPAKSVSPISGQSNNSLNVPQSFVISKSNQPQQSCLQSKQQSSLAQTPKYQSTLPKRHAHLIMAAKKERKLVEEGNQSPNHQPVISFISGGMDALKSMHVEDQKLLLASTKLLDQEGDSDGNDEEQDGENLSDSEQQEPVAESSEHPIFLCPVCMQLVNNVKDHIRERHHQDWKECGRLFNRKTNSGTSYGNDVVQDGEKLSDLESEDAAEKSPESSDRIILQESSSFDMVCEYDEDLHIVQDREKLPTVALEPGNKAEKSTESSDKIRPQTESSFDEDEAMHEDLQVFEPEDVVDPLAGTDPIKLEPGVIFDDNDYDKEEERKISKTEPVAESSEMCPICKLLVNNVKDHVREKHNFVCGICEKVFNKKANLITHLAVHSEKRGFVCKLCDKSYKSKAALFLHERSHNKKKRPTCEYCSKTFRLISYLQAHLQKHHADVANTYVCDTCGEEFWLKRLWMTHRNRHLEEGIICMVCGRRFPTDEELKAHSSVHTKENLVHKFCCDVCGRTFRELHFLTAHRQAHEQRLFVCEKCQKEFKTQTELEKHFTSKHRYKCNKCSEHFEDTELLKEHRKDHSKRLFKCSDCSCTFYTLNQVQLHHDRVHLNKKVLVCNICDKTFSTINSLKVHTADCMLPPPHCNREADCSSQDKSANGEPDYSIFIKNEPPDLDPTPDEEAEGGSHIKIKVEPSLFSEESTEGKGSQGASAVAQKVSSKLQSASLSLPSVVQSSSVLHTNKVQDSSVAHTNKVQNSSVAHTNMVQSLSVAQSSAVKGSVVQSSSVAQPNLVQSVSGVQPSVVQPNLIQSTPLVQTNTVSALSQNNGLNLLQNSLLQPNNVIYVVPSNIPGQPYQFIMGNAQTMSQYGSQAIGIIPLPNTAIGQLANTAMQPMVNGNLQQIPGGTLQQIGPNGTFQQMPNGSIQQMTGGTIQPMNSSTIQQMPNGTFQQVPGGTIQQLPNGTFQQVPAGTIQQLPNGTFQQVPAGTIQQMPDGTFQQIGVGTIQQLPNGSFQQVPTGAIQQVTGGTIHQVSGGTIQQLPNGNFQQVTGGTIQQVPGGTIQQIQGGTIQQVPGGTIQQVPGGTIQQIQGGTIQQIQGGTIQQVTGGTIQQVQGGTIQQVTGGTIQPVPGGTIQHISSGNIQQLPAGTIQHVSSATTQQIQSAVQQVSSSTTAPNQTNALQQVTSSTIQQIQTGSIQQVAGGTVQQVQNGTVHVAGTTQVTASSIQKIQSGTVQQIQSGTIQQVAGGTIQQIQAATVQQMSTGTIQQFANGTIQQLSTTGTIQKISSGTIQQVTNSTIPQISTQSMPITNGLITQTAQNMSFSNSFLSQANQNIQMGATAMLPQNLPVSGSFVPQLTQNMQIPNSFILQTSQPNLQNPSAVQTTEATQASANSKPVQTVASCVNNTQTCQQKTIQTTKALLPKVTQATQKTIVSQNQQNWKAAIPVPAQSTSKTLTRRPASQPQGIDSLKPEYLQTVKVVTKRIGNETETTIIAIKRRKKKGRYTILKLRKLPSSSPDSATEPNAMPTTPTSELKNDPDAKPCLKPLLPKESLLPIPMSSIMEMINSPESNKQTTSSVVPQTSQSAPSNSALLSQATPDLILPNSVPQTSSVLPLAEQNSNSVLQVSNVLSLSSPNIPTTNSSPKIVQNLPVPTNSLPETIEESPMPNSLSESLEDSTEKRITPNILIAPKTPLNDSDEEEEKPEPKYLTRSARRELENLNKIVETNNSSSKLASTVPASSPIPVAILPSTSSKLVPILPRPGLNSSKLVPILPAPVADQSITCLFEADDKESEKMVVDEIENKQDEDSNQKIVIKKELEDENSNSQTAVDTDVERNVSDRINNHAEQKVSDELNKTINAEQNMSDGLSTTINAEQNVSDGLNKTMNQTVIIQPPLDQFLHILPKPPAQNSSDMFKCPKCWAELDNMADLEMHKRIYHNKRYPCVCGKGFESMIGLKIHRHTCPKVSNPCETNATLTGEYFIINGEKVCDGESSGVEEDSRGIKEELDENYEEEKIVSVDNEKLKKCSHCKMKVCNMDYHLARCKLKANGKYACEVCAKVFPSSFHCNEHMEEHERKHSCKVCKRSFDKGRALITHMAKHYREVKEDKKFKCDKCHFTFRLKSDLQVHALSHSDGMPVYRCDDCNITFSSDNVLLTHLASHSSRYKCKTCRTKFSCNSLLQRHIKEVHKEVDSNPSAVVAEPNLNLVIFDSEFVSISDTNASNVLYKCKLCTRLFASKNNVRTHIKSHYTKQLDNIRLESNFESSLNKQDVRVFKCKLCGCRYVSEKIVLSHIKSHFLKRPFVCNTCGCTYDTSDKLKQHRLFHEETKPIKIAPKLGPRTDSQSTSSESQSSQNESKSSSNESQVNAKVTEMSMHVPEVPMNETDVSMNVPDSDMSVLVPNISMNVSEMSVNEDVSLNVSDMTVSVSEMNMFPTEQMNATDDNDTAEKEKSESNAANNEVDTNESESMFIKMETPDLPEDEVQEEEVDDPEEMDVNEMPEPEVDFEVDEGVESESTAGFPFSLDFSSLGNSYDEEEIDESALTPEINLEESEGDIDPNITEETSADGKKYCPKCKLPYRSLKAHSFRCPMKYSRLCKPCGRYFKNEIGYNIHFNKMHLQKSSEVFSCDKCSSTFRLISELNAHSRTHDSVPVFTCPMCGVSFSSEKVLNTHLNTHFVKKNPIETAPLHKENPRIVPKDTNFQCNICDKNFVAHSDLVEHIKIHFNRKRTYGGMRVV